MVALDRDEAAKVGLGASEAAGVLGCSPFVTASDVWLAKVGLGRGREDSPGMHAGRELERPILRLAGEAAGVRFTHNAQTFAHPRWPEVPLFATPDGFGPGRRVLAEVKLVGHRFSDWAAGPPDYVRAQVAVQLVCLPRTHRAIVAALVGSEVRTWQIDRDELEDKLVADLVDWWYRYVVPEVAPDPDTPASAWRLARALADTAGVRAQRLATPDEQRAGAELLAVNRQITASEARADELRRLLATYAAGSDIAGVGWSATWRERGDVSWKGVATDAGATPELIERHTRRSSSFAFRSSASVEPLEVPVR